MNIRSALRDLIIKSAQDPLLRKHLGNNFDAHSFNLLIKENKNLKYTIIFKFLNSSHKVSLEIFLGKNKEIVKHLFKKTFDFSDITKEEVYKEFELAFKSFLSTYIELYNTYTLCK